MDNSLPCPAYPTCLKQGQSHVQNVPSPCLSSPTLFPDWQVTRSLQDTSRKHAAEQGRLSHELRAQEQSLEQTQLELAWAREELQRAWHEGNISQLELNRLNVELRRITGVLGETEREVQEVQRRLNNSENTVALLRSCTALGRVMMEQEWDWHPSAGAKGQMWLFWPHGADRVVQRLKLCLEQMLSL